jgi:hypothetical protein
MEVAIPDGIWEGAGRLKGAVAAGTVGAAAGGGSETTGAEGWNTPGVEE